MLDGIALVAADLRGLEFWDGWDGAPAAWLLFQEPERVDCFRFEMVKIGQLPGLAIFVGR